MCFRSTSQQRHRLHRPPGGILNTTGFLCCKGGLFILPTFTMIDSKQLRKTPFIEET